MFFSPSSFKLGSGGTYFVGGLSVEALASQYGTPLYVLDYQTISENVAKYRDSLRKYYSNSRLIYAGKANLTVGLINILTDLGMGLDVVSGGELYTALKSKIDPSQIFFHGNNKSEKELEMAIENGIFLVVDNSTELQRIIDISIRLDRSVKILIRVKPGIEAHTHDYIKTGQEDSKFGVGISEFYNMVETVSVQNLVELVGIHSHIGSQIFQIEPFLDLVDVQCSIVKHVYDQYGIKLIMMNIGGGIGIRYIEEDAPPDISNFIQAVSERLVLKTKELGIDLPELILEPGRSIVGNAGITIYTIGAIKKVSDSRTYLFVDGGMADNPRPMMYQSSYTFGLGYKSTLDKYSYVIAGKYCESGDILAEDIMLPKPKVDDVLLVFGTGAYNYSMASNYNRSCRPAVVLVDNGTSRLLVERETFDHLIERDQM